MKWNKLYWPMAIFGLFIIYGLDGCGKDKTSPDIGDVAGLVIQSDGTPLSDVQVTLEDVSAYSDVDGYFVLEGSPTGDDLVIEFSKSGYVTNYKKVSVVRNEVVTTRCALATIGSSVSVNASSDQKVVFQGAQVDLPANGLVDQNGIQHTGNYTVKATYFDPTSDNYNDVFPGNFTGISAAGDFGYLESYGFIDVILESGGQELDLAIGRTATVHIPVPTEIVGNAPAEIPLFYFDEQDGEWKEEGKASLVNGKYTGEVSHFSSWNADIMYPMDEMCTLYGRVVDQDGNPLHPALVTATGVDFVGGNSGYTDRNGNFSFLIKADAKVVIYAQIASPITGFILGVSAPILINPTCPRGGSNDIGDIVIKLEDGGGGGGNSDGVWWDVFMQKKINNNNYNAWTVGEGGKIKKCEGCLPKFSENWVDQTSNTSQTLLGVYFTDEDNGWVTGNNGTILKTTNGGDSWSTVSLNTAGNDLYEVVFYGDQYGWMVGSAGSVWYTRDGGSSWNQSVNNIVQNLYDVDFANENVGWAVGTAGKIYWTNSGGQNWSEVNSGTSVDLFSVTFLNSLIGWVGGSNGTLLKTTDGGLSWTTLPSGTTEDILGIDFSAPNRGIATCRNGVLLATVDGGTTWVREDVGSGDLWDVHISGYSAIIGGEDYLQFVNAVQLPEPSAGWQSINSPVSDALFDVEFIDDQVGIAVGYNGKIIRTTDQGRSWNEVTSGTSENLISVDFEANVGYASGERKTMLRSDDGGATWTILNSGGFFDGYYSKVQVYDDKIAWTLDRGEGRMLYTVDSGQTWTAGAGLPLGTLETSYRNFEFFNSLIGYVQYYNDSNNESTMFRTLDGGVSWQSFWVYDSDLVATNLTDLFILDQNTMWASGFSVILRTEDGGANWQNITSDVSANSMYFSDEIRGWGIGGAGGTTIIHTTDSGVNWVSQGCETGRMDLVKDFFMINDEVGIAVGGDGWIGDDAVIYRTTSGGF